MPVWEEKQTTYRCDCCGASTSIVSRIDQRAKLPETWVRMTYGELNIEQGHDSTEVLMHRSKAGSQILCGRQCLATVLERRHHAALTDSEADGEVPV